MVLLLVPIDAVHRWIAYSSPILCLLLSPASSSPARYSNGSSCLPRGTSSHWQARCARAARAIFSKHDELNVLRILHAQNVLIAGGSQGLGLCLANLLAQRGAHVTVVARTQSKLDAALEEIKVCLSWWSSQVTFVLMSVCRVERHIVEIPLNAFSQSQQTSRASRTPFAFSATTLKSTACRVQTMSFAALEERAESWAYLPISPLNSFQRACGPTTTQPYGPLMYTPLRMNPSSQG